MSDRITKTVQNLRALPPNDRLQAIFEDGSLLDVLLAAADDRDRYAAALKRIEGWAPSAEHARDIARAALAGKAGAK